MSESTPQPREPTPKQDALAAGTPATSPGANQQARTGGDALVRVRHLTRRFGNFVAVNDISFDIPRGRVFGFLGPNGSGKSTTIRMLAGLLAPTSGSITGLGGLDAMKQTELWKHKLGYMSQKFSLYTDLTVAENLRFFGSVYGLTHDAIERRMVELTSRLKCERTLPMLTGGLSTGLRQRVALAAALLHEPELLFLDEPTGGVDPRGRRMFWDLIYELAADRGMTVLVTTHYMDEAEQCDRLVMILNGRLISEGTPVEIKAGLAGRLLEVVPSRDPFVAMSEAQRLDAIEDAYLYGVRLRVVSAPGKLNDVSARLRQLGEVTSAEPTLEDAFVALVRQRGGMDQ
jgi:ABC-type multidrug transport system ATPase subunit